MSKGSKSHKRRVRPGAAGSNATCTALMVVDQTPFLQKALSTCKRLRKELHKKQAMLADFEEHDRNAFQQWLNGTHGASLTQIRENRDEVAAYQFILHHLSQCTYYAFEDVPKLYKELLKRKKEGTLYSYVSPQEAEQVDSDDKDDDAWDKMFEGGEGEDLDDEEDDELKDFYDRIFGGGDSAEEDDSAEARSVQGSQATNDARLKSCYRNLAKRLHPDHSELEEALRDKRWHEIQEAYHQGDLEGLLRVEAICDMDEAGLSLKLGLARLRDLAAYHQSHLIPIRNALRAAKQDIAFGFSKKGPSPKIKRETAQDLKEELYDLKEMMGHMARSAKGIRDEVMAHIRENEILAARREQVNKSRQARQAKARPAPKNPASPAKASKPTSAEQMSFF
jgi:hypothetical protein